MKPKIVLTDKPAVLFLRPQSSVPLVHLAARPTESDADASSEPRLSASTDQLTRHFSLLGYEWQLPPGFEADWPAVTELLQQLARHVDPWEPFGRIHDAIREAQRIGSQGPDAHVQAA